MTTAPPPDDDAKRRRAEAEARLRALAERVGLTEDDNRTLTEQRIDVIMNMMCDGKWVTGQTDRQLGSIWNLKRDRMALLAAEANRHIRAMWRDSPEAKEELLAMGLQSFQRIANKAEELGGHTGLRVALEAQSQLLTFLGMKPAQKQEHSGPGGTPLAPAQVLILPPKEEEPDEPQPDGSPAPAG